MRIAVFGYYHAVNQGDDHLQAALTHALGAEHELIFLRHHQDPPISLLRQCDWALLGGGQIMHSHIGVWRNMRRWIQASGVRVGVVGAGVSPHGPELAAELRDLLDCAEFISVRDRESKRLLGGGSQVRVDPDLTWLMPMRRPATLLEERGNIAVSLGFAEANGFRPEPWMQALAGYPTAPLPLYFSRDPKKGDWSFLRQYYPSVPDWFTAEPLWNAPLLVGFRYHAIHYALQLRLPFVAIAYDTKLTNLCADAGLEELCLPADRPDQLRECIEQTQGRTLEWRHRIDLFALDQEARAEEFNIFLRHTIREKKRVSLRWRRRLRRLAQNITDLL